MEALMVMNVQESTTEKTFEFTESSQLLQASKVVSELGVSAAESSHLSLQFKASMLGSRVKGKAKSDGSSKSDSEKAEAVKQELNSKRREYYVLKVIDEPRAMVKVDFSDLVAA